MDSFYTVYRHYDADGCLLYVGCSINPFARLVSHEFHSTWGGDIRTVKIERFRTQEEALEAEATAIAEENPRYNKQRTRCKRRGSPLGRPRKYDPTPRQKRRHWAIWTDGHPSEKDRLAAIEEDYGAPVTRQTLNGRYGNPTNPKPAPA